MGLLAELAAGHKSPTAFPGTQRGRGLWNEIFNSTDKETSTRKPPTSRGDSYGRSVTGTAASQKRLLQAMRSMAPGGWSDDRFEQTKHQTGAAHVAIDRTGRQFMQAECKVYHKDPGHPDGKRPVLESDPPQGDRIARPHDLVELLEKPNNQDTFGLLMYRWNQQLRLTGMALTWMVPNDLGSIAELYVVPTCIAIPQPAVNPDYPDGYYRIQPLYPYGPFSSYPTPASAVGAPIPAQWMLRFMIPHPLFRYEGYSPLTAMRLEMDEFEQIGRSRWYKMKRSVNPSAVLNMSKNADMNPLPEEEQDRVHAEWENEVQGVDKAGSLIICPPGGELEEWGQAPKEMDYKDGWDQLCSFILGGAFGITKQAAGMIEDSSYATLFATLKQLHLITLEPDCAMIAAYLTRHLACFFGDDLIVEIHCKRIDDHEVTFQKVDRLISGKLGTYNEARKLLGLPPTEEEWGDKRIGQEEQEMQEQQMQQQQAAAQAGGEGGAPAGQPGASPQPVEGAKPPLPGKPAAPPTGDPVAEPAQEAEEVTASRPHPGSLGRGALGPRKALAFGNRKSYYEQVRAALVCGNGVH